MGNQKLTRDRELELAAAIRAGRFRLDAQPAIGPARRPNSAAAAAAAFTLAEHVAPIINRLARNYASSRISAEDIAGEGWWGALEAARDFHPDAAELRIDKVTGQQITAPAFLSFARPYIKSSMRRYAAKNSAQVSVGVDAFRNREASASHPGSAAANKLFRAWKHAASMNAVAEPNDGRESTLANHRSLSVIEQGYEDVDAALDLPRTQKAVRAAVAQLRPTLRAYAELALDGYCDKDIQAALTVSQPRVSQLKKAAFAELRAALSAVALISDMQ